METYYSDWIMMQEIIDITPDMMHKYYRHLDNNFTYKSSEVDKYNKYSKKYKNEMKCVLGMIVFIPLFIYIISIL